MLWFMVLGCACLIAAVAWVVWGVVEWGVARRTCGAPAKVAGEVCGLVHHRPFMRYEQEGEVPQEAFRIWGRTTAHGVHGFYSIPQGLTGWTWYPCVRFFEDGEEKTVVFPSAGKAGVWRVGQSVHVLYDPARPMEYALEGDPAPRHAVRGDFIKAAIFAAAGIVLLAWYLH